jgi:hypothetical protein
VRRRVVLLLVGAGLLVAASPADDAATALRDDPVYVDRAAEAMLPSTDEAELRRRVEAAGTPVFVAVLPHAAGEADTVLREVRREVGAPGTYLVVVGDGLRAASDVVGSADQLAAEAVRAHAAEGVAETLDALVDDVRAAVGEQAAPPGTSPPADRDTVATDDDPTDEAGTSPVLLVAGAVAFLGGLVWLALRRRAIGPAR